MVFFLGGDRARTTAVNSLSTRRVAAVRNIRHGARVRARGADDDGGAGLRAARGCGDGLHLCVRDRVDLRDPRDDGSGVDRVPQHEGPNQDVGS